MPFPIVDGLRALEIGSPGALRLRLNQLILDGRKRATAGLLLEYVRENEELESEGELLALVDDDARRIATSPLKNGARAIDDIGVSTASQLSTRRRWC
jgi:hypothetical protein